MRPQGSSDELEKRRRHAVCLYRKGLRLREVARRSDASASSVHRWIRTWRQQGAKGLASRATPGRPSKLTLRQLEKIQKILIADPAASGFDIQVWTLMSIRRIIDIKFKIWFHPSHLSRMLRANGIKYIRAGGCRYLE
jgi:transposase